MPEQSQPTEHRLALVMNGGVSLAVWMGGLAREVDNARRASAGAAAPPPDQQSDSQRQAAEDELFALWAGHLAKTRLVIDVVAGTSAGGLNGVLLAMAAARDTPLNGLRELWMTAAQLSEEGLFSSQTGEPGSVLNGDFFLEQVTAALQDLGTSAGPAPTDVTLTVTSTALSGDPRTMTDDYNAFFSEPDHRRRFEFHRVAEQFTYQPSPEGTFGFETTARDDFTDIPTVARAGRASASFPVAFKPVDESPGLRERRTWPTWQTGPQLEWLADGGILDNSPFEPVLKAIASQPVSSTWRRTLCYVVPSASEDNPNQPGEAGTATSAGAPPPWTTVASKSFNLPKEADFRDDIEQLHDLIRVGRSSYDVLRFQSLLASPELLAQSVELSMAGFGLYRQSQAAAGVYRVRDATRRPEKFVGSIQDVLVSGVADGEWKWLADAFPQSLPVAWTWGTVAAQHVVSTLLRSLATDATVSDDLRSALSTISVKVAAVDRAVTAAMEPMTLPADADAEMAAGVAETVYGDLQVPTVLGDLMTTAVTLYATGKLNGEGQALEVLQAALAVEVVNGAGGLPVEPRPSPIFKFMRMGLSTPPLRYANAVAIAQARAVQGPRGASDASNILYGTRLSHFAAFGKREWREWDWMWGRIHGAVHLGRLLELSADEVDQVVSCIVRAEGMTAEQVEDGIDEVFAQTQKTLLDTMKSMGEVPLAVDAAFSLLNSRMVTAPPVPNLIRTVSWWATVAGARTLPSSPSLNRKQKLLRFVARSRRGKWWRSLGG